MQKPDPRFDEEFESTRRLAIREEREDDDEFSMDADVDECDEDSYDEEDEE